MNNKAISIVIPVYNALGYVKRLFDSLLKNFDFNAGEIIIINDSSDDSNSKYLEGFAKTHCCFQLFKNSSNLGFVKSCNLRLKKTKNDILVLLNSDTEIPENFNKKIIDCFASDESIGRAFAIGSGDHKYHIPVFKNYTTQQMQDLLNKIHKAEYPVVLGVEGFYFCIKREVIRRQRYLDEIYDMGYFEETDFVMRALKNGWKSVFVDDLYVGHRRNVLFGELIREELMTDGKDL